MISTTDLRFFVVLAGASSLSAASRELDVTPPAVTQRLRVMEEKLGVRLLDRSRGRLVLTDEGTTLAQRGRDILDELGSLTDALVARRDTVAGHLRVVAPLGFGRRYVSPLIAQFRRAYPGVNITLTLSDRPGHRSHSVCDVIIHIGELHDSTFVAKHLAPNERFLCAAPEYLKRRGVPTRPEHLLSHDCIILRENDEDGTRLRFVDKGGKLTSRVRVQCILSSNDGEAIKTWALAGLGIIVRSEWDVADDLRSGRLTRVLDSWCLPSGDIFALSESRHGRSARAARFLERLRAYLTPVPWRS